MAKALGLIGNFKGKLGNTVGYNLKDSNNKQTQGVRVYQPVVRNPKTAAQAEQRAKLAPINATYRALKMIIDRGQEGKAYGNKSRLAWLSDAMKAFDGGWFEKGAAIVVPAWVPLTKGSLPVVELELVANGAVQMVVPDTEGTESIATIGDLSTLILTHIPNMKEGDQITFVGITATESGINGVVESIVLNTTSTTATPTSFANNGGYLSCKLANTLVAGTIILSREGDNGAHLRSTASLQHDEDLTKEYTDPADKQAAIESYMSQGANTDWAEESLM